MWQIHFYEGRRGKNPVLDFINSSSPRGRAKVNNVFRLLEELGTNLGMPHARRIDGRLWELRPGDDRLFYCLSMERKFVVRHGFRKQSKTPKRKLPPPSAG